jgi:hypothetical protein
VSLVVTQRGILYTGFKNALPIAVIAAQRAKNYSVGFCAPICTAVTTSAMTTTMDMYANIFIESIL